MPGGHSKRFSSVTPSTRRPQGARPSRAGLLFAVLNPTHAWLTLPLIECGRKKAVGAPCSCQRNHSKATPAIEPMTCVLPKAEFV